MSMSFELNQGRRSLAALPETQWRLKRVPAQPDGISTSCEPVQNLRILAAVTRDAVEAKEETSTKVG